MDNYGYIRVGAAVPQVNVADVDHNVAKMVDIVRQASKRSVQVLAFPELSITGYTCGDLFASERLLALHCAATDSFSTAPWRFKKARFSP